MSSFFWDSFSISSNYPYVLDVIPDKQTLLYDIRQLNIQWAKILIYYQIKSWTLYFSKLFLLLDFNEMKKKIPKTFGHPLVIRVLKSHVYVSNVYEIQWPCWKQLLVVTGNRLVESCGRDPEKLCTPCEPGTYIPLNNLQLYCLRCTQCIGMIQFYIFTAILVRKR